MKVGSIAFGIAAVIIIFAQTSNWFIIIPLIGACIWISAEVYKSSP